MAAEPDPDDPVGYFLEELTYHGKHERTLSAYERVLRDFESFVADPDRGPGDGTPLGEVGRRECMAWVHSVRGSQSESTVATYASYLHRFYAYMTQTEVFDTNPMGLVREEMDERIDTDPTRRDVSVPEMRAFVRDITHPLDRAVVLTLLKTGVRVGELCNLDCRDLSLARLDGTCYDEETRAQLAGRGDALFVASDVSRGDVVNGGERTASNKRERATVVPVDAELAVALERWLAIRPDPVSPARPLFVSTADRWGRRLTPDMVRSTVRDHATAAGWYREGGRTEENVTPHYFRHFFTTHLRDRTGDRGVVKYLRGDVATDIIDTYTHNWGDRVSDVYREHIYSLR